MEKSVLTGEWIPKEVANRRPYAVMLNNIKVASPQSGTQDADILYEIFFFLHPNNTVTNKRHNIVKVIQYLF